MNKVSILTVFISLLLISGNIFAQNLLRYNYSRNGYKYTGTERIRVSTENRGGMPIEIKLNRIKFKDGAKVFVLRIDYEDVKPWKMPVNAPLLINTTSGKTITLRHSSSAPNLVAPEGINTPKGKVYWNYGEYYLEEPEIKKIISGVSNIDITKRWSEEGHIKIYYKNNEFGNAVSKLYKTIEQAPILCPEIEKQLKSLQDKNGSRLAETKFIKVNEEIEISMVYLYYAPTNNESYDLCLSISGKTIPLGATVRITTASGKDIILKQEKDMVAGKVLCYPSANDIKAMQEGVSKIYIETTDLPINLQFTGNSSFSKAIDTLYNALQTIAIL